MMTSNDYYLLVSCVAGWSIAVAAVLTGRRNLAIVAVLGALVVFFSSIQTWSQSLGRPKSVGVETIKVPEAEVQWFRIAKPQIYAILEWGQGPRLYAYPWTESMERQLQAARIEAKATKSKIMAKNPFGKNLDMKGSESAGDGGVGSRPGTKTDDNKEADAKFWVPPPPPLEEKEQ